MLLRGCVWINAINLADDGSSRECVRHRSLTPVRSRIYLTPGRVSFQQIEPRSPDHPEAERLADSSGISLTVRLTLSRCRPTLEKRFSAALLSTGRCTGAHDRILQDGYSELTAATEYHICRPEVTKHPRWQNATLNHPPSRSWVSALSNWSASDGRGGAG